MLWKRSRYVTDVAQHNIDDGTDAVISVKEPQFGRRVQNRFHRTAGGRSRHKR